MHRFFIESESLSGQQIEIIGEDAQHIGRVLRLRPGESILVCDGRGREAKANITSLEKQRVYAALEESFHPAQGEPSAEITLYQCLPKQGKMEWIVQKCVELGVSKIVPVASSRCVVRWEEKDVSKRTARYQRVAYEAAKQCQRGKIPTVESLIPLTEIVPSRHELMLLAYEQETAPLKKVLRQQADGLKNIGLIIGPEGGLEVNEVECLRQQGAISISLGNRILRTETAGMAALCMILYELDG